MWKHCRICKKHGHVGKLWGQHSPVPGSVPVGRVRGQDGAAASGAGGQRLLHLWGIAGWLHSPFGGCSGKFAAAEETHTQVKTLAQPVNKSSVGCCACSVWEDVPSRCLVAYRVIRCFSCLQGCFDQRIRAWQRWQEAQSMLQKKREAEAKLLWANKPDKLQQAKEEISEVTGRCCNTELSPETENGSSSISRNDRIASCWSWFWLL